MSDLAQRVASRFVLAAIKEITKVTIREYSDSGQVKAHVEWVDQKGKKGVTEGDPENAHMKALIDRAKREKVKIEKDKWASTRSPQSRSRSSDSV